MNKNFIGGVIVGVVLMLLWKQERVSSSISFPQGGAGTPFTGTPEEAWDYYSAVWA